MWTDLQITTLDKLFFLNCGFLCFSFTFEASVKNFNIFLSICLFVVKLLFNSLSLINIHQWTYPSSVNTSCICSFTLLRHHLISTNKSQEHSGVSYNSETCKKQNSNRLRLIKENKLMVQKWRKRQSDSPAHLFWSPVCHKRTQHLVEESLLLGIVFELVTDQQQCLHHRKALHLA